MDYTKLGLGVQTARGIRTAMPFILPRSGSTMFAIRLDVARLARARRIVVVRVVPLPRRSEIGLRRRLGVRRFVVAARLVLW